MALDVMVKAIADVLRAVSGIGVVLEFFQYTPDQKSFNALYVSNGVLAPWIVRRNATPAAYRGAGPGNIRRVHMIEIYGYRAVQAGADSEKTHQMLTEAVIAALVANSRLAGGAGFITEKGVPAVAQFAEVMWRGVLCWRATIKLACEEVRQGG